MVNQFKLHTVKVETMPAFAKVKMELVCRTPCISEKDYPEEYIASLQRTLVQAEISVEE